MSQSKFWPLFVISCFDTYFFNDAVLNGAYLWAGFWLFMLYRNLRIAYLATKWYRFLEKLKSK